MDRFGLCVLVVEIAFHLVGEFPDRSDPAIQAGPAQKLDLDLGHVQPTPVFRRVMHLEAFAE